jgi:hypothetical protein
VDELLYESSAVRGFVGVGLGIAPAPDEATVLRLSHMLEKHELDGLMLEAVNVHLEAKGIKIHTGTIVDTTILHAPSSSKNASGELDLEMHQTRKGNQWYFGLKSLIGVDAKEEYAHSVATSAASVSDCHMLPDLLHDEERKCGQWRLSEAGRSHPRGCSEGPKATCRRTMFKDVVGSIKAADSQQSPESTRDRPCLRPRSPLHLADRSVSSSCSQRYVDAPEEHRQSPLLGQIQPQPACRRDTHDASEIQRSRSAHANVRPAPRSHQAPTSAPRSAASQQQTAACEPVEPTIQNHPSDHRQLNEVQKPDGKITRLRCGRVIGKRVVLFSITHKLSTKDEAELDVCEPSEYSPHDRIAWRRVFGSGQVSVTPAAIQIRVPAGRSITVATPQLPREALRDRRYLRAESALLQQDRSGSIPNPVQDLPPSQTTDLR